MPTRSYRQNLRYLDASCVNHPAGTLKGVDVRGRNRKRIGEIDGVLVDPARRRVRYFVVERPAMLKTSRYLLPVECLATLCPGDDTIYIDETVSVTERFDLASVPPFSDDDLVEAIFASSAA